MFTAIGVMATVALLFSILPVFLHRFPVSEELIRRQSGGSGKNGKGGGRDDSHLPGWAKRMFGFVIHRPLLTCAIWFAVMGVFATGFTKIETSVSLLKLLDEDTDLIHDYAWLETNLGNLVPMEIVLTVPVERCRTADENAEADGRQYRDTMLERLNMVRDIQRRVEALPEVSRNMSVATYTPNRTDSGNPIVNQGTDYAKNKSLEESRAKLLETGYLRVEQITDDAGHQTTGRELWRLSARVAALGEDSEGVDYGDFVKELKKAVDPILVAYQQRDMIVTALHQAEKKLDGAQLCLLYRSRSETSELQESSQEFVLRDLLKRSGVEQHAGKNTGLTTFNLAKLDKHKDDAEYMDRVIELLSKQDALLIVSASSDPQVKNLAKRGLPVIDVSKVQVYPDSAAIPLATDNGPRPIRAVYTGMIPLVYKTQRQLLVSLRESILWATVLIAVVMMFVLRSPIAGLISMIPNVFPIVIIFGLLGWVGIKVDIGIMMTASVALGVAVDDTVHFLTWFRRGVKQGLNRVQAVMLAYDRCATAMLQTTVIGGLGLAVFATSTFTPTQQFGYLMISMLGAALVGDLLLLPAILVGPLGKFFGGPAPAAGATTDWNQAPALHASPAAQTAEPVQLGEKPTEPAANPAETVGSESPLAAAVGQEAETEEPQELIEGPHAALHAKLRSLRRDEHRQDSVSS
ncbi:MAG: MMPL family transporter [Planctomycetes bacterium]|nr:MMPL family transporter [Planctomycetota bacterium]